MVTFKTQEEDPEYLENISELIDNYCSPEWKHVLEIYRSTAEHKKDDVIFLEGTRMEVVHIIDTGKAKISTRYNKNNERIIRLATDGMVIGHRGIGLDFVYSVTATALTDVRLTLIPIDVFKSLLRANNLFSYYFMLFFAEELKRAERHIKALASLSVTQRIARALRMNLEAFGTDPRDSTLLNFTLSRDDLSKLAGTTYETLIRTLGSLGERGIIRVKGKKIHILNEDDLRTIAKGKSE